MSPIRRAATTCVAGFPSLRSRLPTLWTNSYFVSIVGGLAVLKRYIENQKAV